MYCTKCGNEGSEQARFCASCGTALGAVQRQSASPGAGAGTLPVTRVVVAKPKRGGRLGLIGFLLSLGLIWLGNLGLDKVGGKDAQYWSVGAFAIGAAYIVTTLLKWIRGKEVIKGETIAWTLAGLLAIGCLGALGQTWTVENSRDEAASKDSQTQPANQPTAPPATSSPAQAPLQLTQKEMREARRAYASEFDSKMIDAGIESTTISWGPTEQLC